MNKFNCLLQGKYKRSHLSAESTSMGTELCLTAEVEAQINREAAQHLNIQNPLPGASIVVEGGHIDLPLDDAFLIDAKCLKYQSRSGSPVILGEGQTSASVDS